MKSALPLLRNGVNNIALVELNSFNEIHLIDDFMSMENLLKDS